MSRLREEVLAPVQRHMPGYADAVAALPFAQREAPGNGAIGLFRDHDGPGLLVPQAYGGAGLPATEAIGVQRGIGYLSPSTAVATAMHQFTIATLAEIVKSGASMEWMVIEAVARQRLLVASGFAEGDPHGKVLRPTMRLRQHGVGYRLNGEKKPCSLSESMDLITVSAVVPQDSSERFAVALVPARSEGVTVAPFWRSPVLAGAETGCVRFTEVPVPEAALSYVGDAEMLDATQVRGYVWFECLIAASYLGAAAALVDCALGGGRARSDRATAMGSDLALCAAGLETCAGHLDRGDGDSGLLATTLLVRYGVEAAIQRATDMAFELLGSASLASSIDIALLLAASRALSFHPPSRVRAEAAMAKYMDGDDLILEPAEPTMITEPQ